MNKLVFYVPESHKEAVKQAVFEQGAGKFEGYDCCSWEILGTGQFKPLTGSKPFIGQQDTIEIVAEYRVEMICADQYIKAVLTALVKSHPYETPAYEVWSIKTLADF
jgi:hypothetical protein